MSILILLLPALFKEHGSKRVPLSGQPVRYTAEELTSLFFERQDGFQEISQIILDNELHGKPGKFRFVYSVGDYPKQFFKNEEWEKISQFFDDIRPYEVMRYTKNVLGFHFAGSKDGGVDNLYYFRDGKTDLAYHSGKYHKFTEIAPFWYLGERNLSW